MIPKQMEAFLRERLPERTWENRLVREDGRCYMEFSAWMWTAWRAWASRSIAWDRSRWCACGMRDSPLEVGGYLVVDNLAMGRPSMGGIRMLPDITPASGAQPGARHDPQERRCQPAFRRRQSRASSPSAA